MSDARERLVATISDIYAPRSGTTFGWEQRLTDAIADFVCEEIGGAIKEYHDTTHGYAASVQPDPAAIERVAYERGARELAAYYDASLAVKAGSIVERFLKEQKPQILPPT